MRTELSEYFPLALLIGFCAFVAFVLWRGEYKIGAYVVQVVSALFVSSVAGFTLFVLSAVMFTTWFFADNTFVVIVVNIVMFAVGSTCGFAVIKRYGTSENIVSSVELIASLALGTFGGAIGFLLLKDATFGADFVDHASGSAGAYFGALLLGNSPLIVGGLIRVLQNNEP